MEALTLEQAYYIAEIIGVVAVVGSIIYLGIQVRQSAQATRSDTLNVVTNNAMSQYHILATDTQMFEIVQKGFYEPESLEGSETGRFYSFIFSLLLNWQNFYYHWEKNELDSEGWEPWEILMSDVFSTPGLKGVWAVRKQYFHLGYRQYVEELMSRPLNPDYKFMGVGQSR